MSDYEIIPNRIDRTFDLYCNERFCASFTNLADAEDERDLRETLDQEAESEDL